MILNTLFDVLRGWPREGALDETFEVYGAASLPQGSVIYVKPDGTVDVATTGTISQPAVATWVVVEGNTDYSGAYVGKVVALRANCMLKLDPANFVAGTYAVGQQLTFTAGQFDEASAGDQCIGEVIRNNSATDGTIDVYYSGGMFKTL